MRRALLLGLLLLGSPAAAENFYDRGQGVIVAPPVVVTGPGAVSVELTVPSYGYVGEVYLNDCRIWKQRGHPEYWDKVPVVWDQDVVIYRGPTDYYQGRFTIIIGERREGRTQTWCVRLPFVPYE